MIWALLPAPLRKAAVITALVALVLAAIWAGVQAIEIRAVERDRAARDLERARETIQLQERIRDADVGSGDADDDLCWLARRVHMVPAPPGCE